MSTVFSKQDGMSSQPVASFAKTPNNKNFTTPANSNFGGSDLLVVTSNTVYSQWFHTV